MENEKEITDAFKVVKLIYEGAWQVTGMSWQRLNNALWYALCAAIEAGLKFDETDVSQIWRKFNGHYWFGKSDAHNHGEVFYKKAVLTNNISACISFEKYADREAFKINNKRIFVGAQFGWKEQQVICTSFHPQGEYVNACQYEKTGIRGTNYYVGIGKIVKRFKITQADLKEYRKQQKAEQKG